MTAPVPVAEVVAPELIELLDRILEASYPLVRVGDTQPGDAWTGQQR